MAGVTFKDVSKRYDKISVIEGLNLEIKDHEFMVLVGPSGCGKSTALRMIAGLEEISGGAIAIHDRVVNELEPKDRDIAMVFQSYALYPNMTVRENLEFGLKNRKTPRPEIDRLVNEAAQILGLSELMDRYPKKLSGGQRQRVAVGRAIVRKPAVFLFDEPLSNLDAKLRGEMRKEIKRIQKQLQTTTVYVTHDQIEAMTMGDRISVMKSGKLQQVGTPQEVYETPANVFVATFIGTPPMNFLKGTLADGGTMISTATFKLPVPASLRPATAGKDGQKVLVGIRPEHVFDLRERVRGESAPISVEVELIEPVGDMVFVHTRVGDETLVYKVDPHRAPSSGAKVEVYVELASVHLFDATTELRIRA